jgi:serine/threonine protein kinase
MPDEDISNRETQLAQGAEAETQYAEHQGARSEASSSLPVGDAHGLGPGSVLFGAYEIVEILGTGGMGAVYRAKHLSLGGLRAIKVMHPSLSSNAEAVERFHREARALLEVHHPAVVRCHDLLRDDEGRVFLVMELIEGISLSDRLAQGPLSPDQVRDLGERVASGLAAAHARGVIHRDLSPDNIVMPDGRPDQAKLIDFGIAKVLQAGEETVAEGFKGKLNYASPEQLGFFGGKIDARSDYYSLGLVLCAAAAGEPIEMGRTFAEAVDARRELGELPQTVPSGLRRQIEPLLAFDPDNRPESTMQVFHRAEGIDPTLGAGKASARWSWGIATALGAALLAALALLDPFSRTPLETAPAVSAPAPSQEFEALRSRLARAGAPGGEARVTHLPNPVRDGAPYTLQIESDCECTPLVFSIDADSDQIDLLYPNALDRAQKISAEGQLEIPASPMYVLEARAGSGIDRIVVLLAPQEIDFPPAGVDFWSTTDGEPERMQELSKLLDRAAEMEWSSAETALHIVP